MKFKKGYYRFVLLFPFLGIAVKFPIIHLIRVIWNIFRGIGHLRMLTLWREITLPINCTFGFKNHLFKGIIDNWKEFLFFRKTKHPFLQPTYFSLFGFLNIQQIGEPCNIAYTDLWRQLDELTNGRVWDDGHHFENPANFCFYNGKLRMLDYGDQRTHRVVEEYGLKILESFDSSYDWEEKKELWQTKK